MTLRAVLLILSTAAAAFAAQPFHQAQLIFPPETWHVHSSCVVEAPNGDLIAVWYHGSGERQADDVKLEMARKVKGEKEWRPRFTVADTPRFPDTNPALFVDAQKRLWLLWPVIIANEWHTALMKYWISSDYQDRNRPPRWEFSDVMLFQPRDFTAETLRVLAQYEKTAPPSERLAAYIAQMKQRAADKYFMRMGWMTRAHPVQLPSGRIIVPLYSDGYSFSLMALSDDNGKNWTTSKPLVGGGAIQPSIARRKDGTLVAYMRDNGPPPKRLHVSESKDDGVTWTDPRDSDIPNPGSGAEVTRLANGFWALIYNDTEKGRNSLAVSISDDEGKSWKWTRHLELQPEGSFHYPSIIQGRDGMLHATYSHFVGKMKSIKHAAFNLEWVQEGDRK